MTAKASVFVTFALTFVDGSTAPALPLPPALSCADANPVSATADAAIYDTDSAPGLGMTNVPLAGSVPPQRYQTSLLASFGDAPDVLDACRILKPAYVGRLVNVPARSTEPPTNIIKTTSVEPAVGVYSADVMVVADEVTSVV